MSFINFLDDLNESKFTEFKSRIEKCTKKDYDKVVKDLDVAFKDKTITAKEYDELDDKLFQKIKLLNNKSVNENDDKEENKLESDDVTETVLNINSFNIDIIINKFLISVSQIHIWHLLASSGQKHLALGELYDNLQNSVDSLAEKFIAQGGTLSAFESTFTVTSDNQLILDFIDYLRQDVTYILNDLKHDENLSSYYHVIANVQQHIDEFVYKFNLN